jgi:phosphopantetheine adenylyltransferase
MFKAFYLSKQAIQESLREERGSIDDPTPPAIGMVIGKFSPLTIGHKKMINQLLIACKQRDLVPVVAVVDVGGLNTTDRLLTGAERKQLIESVYPTVEVMVTANAFQALVNVKETGGDLDLLVCGEDRVDKYRDLSSKIFDVDYQKTPPDVRSLSRTDADDPTSLASSTKARQAVADNDIKSFTVITGQPQRQAASLFELLRNRMGLE